MCKKTSVFILQKIENIKYLDSLYKKYPVTLSCKFYTQQNCDNFPTINQFNMSDTINESFFRLQKSHCETDYKSVLCSIKGYNDTYDHFTRFVESLHLSTAKPDETPEEKMHRVSYDMGNFFFDFYNEIILSIFQETNAFSDIVNKIIDFINSNIESTHYKDICIYMTSILTAKGGPYSMSDIEKMFLKFLCNEYQNKMKRLESFEESNMRNLRAMRSCISNFKKNPPSFTEDDKVKRDKLFYAIELMDEFNPKYDDLSNQIILLDVRRKQTEDFKKYQHEYPLVEKRIKTIKEYEMLQLQKKITQLKKIMELYQ